LHTGIQSAKLKINNAGGERSKRVPMSADAEKRRMGPFQLESKLGVGGMGIVWLATYLKTGQQCALKVLAPDLSADPKIAKRFEREMDILRKLKHPHIIRYYGGGSSDNQRYYAMEILAGGALDTLLKKKGRFTWEETIEYTLQVAQALEHAHNASVIHRDLKPSNLLLSKNGKLKLSDFGIARDNQATQLTAAGKTVGTMAYMAPEQITGRHPISRKTDLYALGCVMFEMLTGRPPFQSEGGSEADSESPHKVLFRHLEEPPPSVRDSNIDCPLWLDKLIAELLEKEPDDRPYDALAVQVKLEEIKAKVAERASIVANTTAVGGGATIKNGDKTIAALLGKKRRKKKKRDQTPIYERAWFLSVLLAGIVAFVTWTLWRDSEEEVFARVQPLMASTDPGVWFDAEPDLQTIVARFPDGEHATQAKAWLADIELERAIRQLEKVEMQKPGYSPDTEGERLYEQAQQYERFGDRFGALDTYDSMNSVLAADQSLDTRVILALARRNSQRLRADGGAGGSRVDFVQKQLDGADDLYREGKRLEAREKWRSIVNLYGGKPEFEPLVKLAEDRLDNPERALSKSPPKSETAPDAAVGQAVPDTTSR
jgi:serine/threonine-protein kinase